MRARNLARRSNKLRARIFEKNWLKFSLRTNSKTQRFFFRRLFKKEAFYRIQTCEGTPPIERK